MRVGPEGGGEGRELKVGDRGPEVEVGGGRRRSGLDSSAEGQWRKAGELKVGGSRGRKAALQGSGGKPVANAGLDGSAAGQWRKADREGETGRQCCRAVAESRSRRRDWTAVLQGSIKLRRRHACAILPTSRTSCEDCCAAFTRREKAAQRSSHTFVHFAAFFDQNQTVARPACRCALGACSRIRSRGPPVLPPDSVARSSGTSVGFGRAVLRCFRRIQPRGPWNPFVGIRCFRRIRSRGSWNPFVGIHCRAIGPVRLRDGSRSAASVHVVKDLTTHLGREPRHGFQLVARRGQHGLR